jgi:predicted RNA-binding protein Jag
MKKTPSECLESQLKKYGLMTEKHKQAIDKYLHPIFEAMDYYAEHAVNEQRELMAKHLNMRNVPRPII